MAKKMDANGHLNTALRHEALARQCSDRGETGRAGYHQSQVTQAFQRAIVAERAELAQH